MTTHTNTTETNNGSVFISIDVDYYVPRQGDTISSSGYYHTLSRDMKPRIEIDHDGERYHGQPMRTKDGTNRIVFAADGFTWREGEYCIKG